MFNSKIFWVGIMRRMIFKAGKDYEDIIHIRHTLAKPGVVLQTWS